jgi:outer membrane protein assembly factor BamB
MRLFVLALVYITTLTWPGNCAAAGVPATDEERTRRDAGPQTDTSALLEYFRTRTPAERDCERLQTLVQQLGSDAFDIRENASAALRKAGVIALPFLRQAAKSPDAEVRDRANQCLGEIHDAAVRSAAANARLLAGRKPAGAATVLLNFLPYAEDAAAHTAIQEALLSLAVRDGRPEPAFVQALADRLPERRSAAGLALCRAGVGPETGVSKLLADREPTVRLEIALALVVRGERSAVPVLIALLTELPVEKIWRIEDVLQRLADDGGPTITLGPASSDRRQERDAWTDWWRRHAATADLTVLVRGKALLGNTLLVNLDTNGRTGKVVELDANTKVRWQITGLQFPTDAQVLPGNRVLVAEHYGMRVTERDLQGKILWQHRIVMPINCQRLPDGNTFIASRNFLLEVDRNHNEVFKISRSNHDIMAARRLRDGRIFCLTRVGQCIVLDRTGKEMRSFVVGQSLLGALDVLANAHVLVPCYGTNRISEYDEEGRDIWHANVAMPNSAHRLATGQTIVASQNLQHVLLLDATGKTVWQYKADGRPWQVFRR